MAYVYLIAAILFEVLGTVTMKYSEGFTKVTPSVVTVILHVACFIALTIALKSLPVSSVYPIWAGVGTALMAFMGLFFFNEPLPLQKVLATSLIVIGVVILSIGDDIGAEVGDMAKTEGTMDLQVKPATSSKPSEVRNAG